MSFIQTNYLIPRSSKFTPTPIKIPPLKTTTHAICLTIFTLLLIIPFHQQQLEFPMKKWLLLLLLIQQINALAQEHKDVVCALKRLMISTNNER